MDCWSCLCHIYAVPQKRYYKGNAHIHCHLQCNLVRIAGTDCNNFRCFFPNVNGNFRAAVATASANTIPGYLQSMLYISAAMIPFGFLGMEGKRILQFRRNNNKNKTIEQLRKIHLASGNRKASGTEKFF